MMSIPLRVAVISLLFAILLAGCGKSERASSRSTGEVSLHASTDASQQNESKFGVTVRRPAGPPRTATGELDANGEPITVSCTTCHATRVPNASTRTTEELDEFHAGLPFSHGTTTCLSCHNRDDYDSLRLSNGEQVEFVDVMTLCAQCHGTQMRDYENGAHGGMNGYWDLNRGPRTRNNCVDCHDPHSPKFPHMVPTFKPIDRFLDNSHEASDAKHE